MDKRRHGTMKPITYNMLVLVSGATATVRKLAPHPNLGILLTPHDGQSAAMIRERGVPWAADNAAYSNWDDAAFCRLLDKIRGLAGCLFVAVPDVVGDAKATLERFKTWAPVVRGDSQQPLAFVGQDGCTPAMVPWDDIRAYFVGGTDAWKQSQESVDLIVYAREHGKHVHLGRVNSDDRLLWAFEHGCHSVDGTSFSRFPDTYIQRALDKLQGWECQRWLF